MIYTDKQLRISAEQLAKFTAALDVAMKPESDSKWVQEIEVDALKSQIAELEAEMAHYRLLKGREVAVSKSHSLETLPTTLIQARIASGLTQAELADAIKVEPQTIQRYEASEYMGVSLAQLIRIARELNVQTETIFQTNAPQPGSFFSWKDSAELEWRQFPFREMVRRRWFDVPTGTDIVEATKEYFLRAAGPQFASALHRKKMRGARSPNTYALLAWQARVLERARALITEDQLPLFTLDDRWLPELVALTRHKRGPHKAKNFLARKGIALVTEEHLPGTFLDGAAMLSDSGHPVIGLTLRYDRLDNFWFVLFHELGHVFLHLMKGVRYDFFDDEESQAEDRIEVEADTFALQSLMSDDQWEHCLSRFALSEEAVQIDAKRLEIDVSILAGRIRKEQGDYTILTNLIRKGVREQLREEIHEAE